VALTVKGEMMQPAGLSSVPCSEQRWSCWPWNGQRRATGAMRPVVSSTIAPRRRRATASVVVTTTAMPVGSVLDRQQRAWQMSRMKSGSQGWNGCRMASMLTRTVV
jgi:hypothetical protein